MTTLTPKLIRQLKAMKARNDHGAAYQVAAEALEAHDLMQVFSDINRKHDELGELTIDLCHKRHHAYEALMARARTALSPDDYQKLYMCF